MSDQHEDKDAKKVPDGMVKKVRRVKGKRRSKQKSPTSSKSLIEQGKSLLEAMQHDDSEEGHVDIQSQLRRLQENEENAKELDEVWGSKKKSSAWIWMSLIGLVIPVIGIAIGVAMLDERGESSQDDLQLLSIEPFRPLEDSIKEKPHAWFHDKESDRDFLAEARGILRAINTAQNPAEITQFLRPSPFREKNPVDLSRWDVPVVVNTSTDISWTLPTVVAEGDSAENARGVLALNLKKENQEEMTACFVYEEERLLLDWDATMGWGEVSWNKIRTERPQRAKILRARLVKKASYDSVIKGVSQSGYLLTNDAGDEFIFAFIPLDSERNQKNDKTLKDLLNYGQLTTVLKSNLRVTVKVRYGDGSGRGDRFEIVDYLHDGWVRP